MRALLVSMLVAVSGCHGAKGTQTAWPAPSTTADDGGESLAPHATTVAAAVEKSADPTDADDKAADDAPKAAASEDKPAEVAPQPSATPTEPVMLEEEVIIEVDD